MRAVVFGTAGHIDHGKTSLVAALTGVDCDGLPEEKQRGITLVLGFAPMPDPAGEIELSFIDVPGHERLVHTMISGAGGIDRALLVVAADEGTMPQTREHLAVLRLLGVAGGVVALNKADLLPDPDLRELRMLEVREALAGSPLADAAIVPCSASTGEGLPALRDAVLACARGVTRRVDPHRPFRLSADRVFSVAGAGTVVTGTALWGGVAVGDELLALPSGRAARVRGLQVHAAARPVAHAGERVAISLAGVQVTEIPRGEQLLAAGPWEPTRHLAVAAELLAGARPLEEGAKVWVHLLAGRTVGRVARLDPAPLPPGRSGRLVVRLARALFAAPGDRLILRAISPAATIGGAVVLATDPAPLRRRDAGQLAEIPDPTRDLDAALARLVAAAGAAGSSPAELGARLALRPGGVEAALGRLAAGGRVLVVPGPDVRLVAVRAVEAVREDARRALDAAPEVGIPVAEFLSRVVPAEAQALRSFYLDDLRRTGQLREVAGRVRRADDTPLGNELATRIEALYRAAGLDAPSPEEAASRLQANPKTVAGVVRFLIDGKRLARVGGKWVLHREVLDGIATAVREWPTDGFDVGQFKEKIGLTRKLAIPILEWLDSERVTRREGERRRILRPRADTTSRG